MIAYHYTNAEGAFGILSRMELWATDVRFLNDESEFQYGVLMAQDAIRRLRRDADGDVARILSIFDAALEVYATGPTAPRRFAVSLSRNGDLLSQWRAYGEEGAGYALGFDTEILRLQHGLECAEVIYDAATVATRMAELVEEGLAERRESAGSVPIIDVAKDLVDKCASLALVSKHGAFEDEREVRLSVSNTPPTHRVRAAELISYVPVVIAPTDDTTVIPALETITLGPTATKRAEVGLREILLSLGYPPGRPSILRSTIPYRR